jgi:hypothetical protein
VDFPIPNSIKKDVRNPSTSRVRPPAEKDNGTKWERVA